MRRPLVSTPSSNGLISGRPGTRSRRGRRTAASGSEGIARLPASRGRPAARRPESSCGAIWATRLAISVSSALIVCVSSRLRRTDGLGRSGCPDPATGGRRHCAYRRARRVGGRSLAAWAVRGRCARNRSSSASSGHRGNPGASPVCAVDPSRFQVAPATPRWTAATVGAAGFEPANLRDPNAALYQTELRPGGGEYGSHEGGPRSDRRLKARGGIPMNQVKGSPPR
jgi:hypothetical protein